MDIKKELNGTELKISVIGKLNTVTAPQLETEIKSSVAGITDLILDFAELDYLSSAGLRVILTAQQIMMKQGKMVIRNVNDTINEIFDVTGFIDILTIE
jgi:anti-sigma B factor antagonist